VSAISPSCLARQEPADAAFITILNIVPGSTEYHQVHFTDVLTTSQRTLPYRCVL
jgi:hypothetical protein